MEDDNRTTDLPDTVTENCTDGSQVVWSSLHMCLTQPMHYIAFCLAIGSLFFWLISHLFLLRARHLEGKTRCQQLLHVVHICSANLCNAVGAQLSGQLGTQVLIAVYFLGADIIFFIHYIYLWCSFTPHQSDGIPYSEWKSPDQARKKQNGNRTRIMCLLLAWVPAMVYMPLASLSSWQPARVQTFGPGRQLLMVSDSDIDNFGFTLGVFAIFIYALAKVPLVKDGLRQEESVLRHFHVCNFSILANICYALSVIIYNQDLKFMLNALPWLLTSGVCTIFDVILLYLIARRHRHTAREKAARQWEEGHDPRMRYQDGQEDGSGLQDDGDEGWQPSQEPRLTAIHEEEEDSDDPTHGQPAAANYSGSDREAGSNLEVEEEEMDEEAAGQRSPIQALPPPPQHPRGGRRQKAANRSRMEDAFGEDLEWDLSDMSKTYREEDEGGSEEDEDVIWDEELIMREVEAELKRREAGFDPATMDPQGDNVSDVSVRSLEFEEIPVDGELEDGMQDEWFDS